MEDIQNNNGSSELDILEDIGPATKIHLIEAGIKSLKELLIRGPHDVSEVTGMTMEKSLDLCNKARIKLEENNVIQRSFIPATESIAHGEKVFMTYCNKCHPSGEAGLGPAINSNPAPQFIKRFQVRHGLGVMPSFKKDEISKEDLRGISAYLRAWKHY